MKTQLTVLGDMPTCIFCNKQAEIMLLKQETKDDLNIFLICKEHWEQFRNSVPPATKIPDAFNVLGPFEE